MSQEDMAGRVMAHAFNDELEKIAKMPAAVRKGGGGVVGNLLRDSHAYGRSVGPKMQEYVKARDALPSLGKETYVRNLRAQLDSLLSSGQGSKRVANNYMRVRPRLDAFTEMRRQNPDLYSRLEEARDQR